MLSSCRYWKVYKPGLILLLLVAGLLSACSDDPDSPEDQIRQFVDAAVKAAENRSVDEVSKLVDEHYIDQQGRNRKQVAFMLRAYFMRHKSIHLFTRIDEIEFLAENNASVSLHVAMAGSVISDVNALTSVRARFYRFELDLFHDDEWLLRHASWARADITAFD